MPTVTLVFSVRESCWNLKNSVQYNWWWSGKKVSQTDVKSKEKPHSKENAWNVDNRHDIDKQRTGKMRRWDVYTYICILKNRRKSVYLFLERSYLNERDLHATGVFFHAGFSSVSMSTLNCFKWMSLFLML